MQETAGASKTYIDATEIDPGDAAAQFEIRWGIKMCIGEIRGLLERSAGENGYAIEARARERDRQETVQAWSHGFP